MNISIFSRDLRIDWVSIFHLHVNWWSNDVILDSEKKSKFLKIRCACTIRFGWLDVFQCIIVFKSKIKTKQIRKRKKVNIPDCICVKP